MSDEKDFLSQFSEKKNTVPESFKQEERKPVTKQRKPVNKTLIIVLCALLLVVGIAVYFIFFAPKIEMPNFVGENKTDVAAWVKQQGIETSGIIFEEDYYFDYDEGTIISQSVEAGKKVKENVKITFTASLGADPDELIKVPDLMNMTKTEIQDWISENKLSKTKITSAYSDSVESGNVISFAYSGCDEDTFTRSSTLKISVSKGEAPAGTIAVEDFTKKTYDYVSSWATSKKVNLTKTEQFSDTVDKGYVISQSIASGKTMKEEETINVVVSKGKAVTIADFSGMSQTAISSWCSKNNVTLYATEEYCDISKGLFVTCSPKAGTVIATGDSIDVVISLGNPTIPSGLTTETELLTWIDEANVKGAELTAVKDSAQFSDTVAAGKLAYYETENEVGDHVHYSVSRGKNIFVGTELENYKAMDENIIRTKLDNLKLTYEVVYAHGTNLEDKINKVLKIYYKDGSNEVTELSNKYIAQDVIIYVVVCDKDYSAS